MRAKSCRSIARPMATKQTKDKKITSPLPLHRVLREILRHYYEFRALVKEDGRNDHIPYAYWVYDKRGRRKKREEITISFWDLHNCLNELAPRKKEAIYYNVILDEKQRDVAKRMGITTVTVGQYVEAGTKQIAAKYFVEKQ